MKPWGRIKHFIQLSNWLLCVLSSLVDRISLGYLNSWNYSSSVKKIVNLSFDGRNKDKRCFIIIIKFVLTSFAVHTRIERFSTSDFQTFLSLARFLSSFPSFSWVLATSLCFPRSSSGKTKTYVKGTRPSHCGCLFCNHSLVLFNLSLFLCFSAGIPSSDLTLQIHLTIITSSPIQTTPSSLIG